MPELPEVEVTRLSFADRIVGAQIQAHPVVRILHKILGVKNAADLGQVIACAGLGQNLWPEAAA